MCARRTHKTRRTHPPRQKQRRIDPLDHLDISGSLGPVLGLLFPLQKEGFEFRFPEPSLQKGDMRDTVNTQYDSFLYWRMPIPELDLSELEHLGLADMAIYKPKGGYSGLATDRKTPNHGLSDSEDGDLLQFNSFNFWRAPIASISPIDFDLI
ncbi:protein AF1q [Sceloporus undulatus]|uniref:protein AF1q n=1 Tax=Sceloporus undulatus TaxID=8520 RepID=UPI001C4D23E3|nr:protein AF1q [Sceloporus undulatus]